MCSLLLSRRHRSVKKEVNKSEEISEDSKESSLMLSDTFGSRNRTAVSAAMRIVSLTKWWMDMNMEMDNKHM